MIEKYTKLGMSVFENVVKEMPELEANRESVKEFIVRMAFGHLNIVTRYGNTREIDLIFIDEVLKFYEASMKIPHDMAELFVVDTYNKMGSTSDFEDGERLVMYPAFAYADRSGVLAHLPTVRMYILKSGGTDLIKLDYDRYEKDVLLHSATIDPTVTISIITDASYFVAKKWNEDKDEEEVEYIAENTIAHIMSGNSEIYKDRPLEEII